MNASPPSTVYGNPHQLSMLYNIQAYFRILSIYNYISYKLLVHLIQKNLKYKCILKIIDPRLETYQICM